MHFFHQVVICATIARRYNAVRHDPRPHIYEMHISMLKSSLFMPARAFLLLSTALALSLAAVAGVASDWVEGHNSRVRLISGGGLAGVELQMPEGWKTYWRNPGDAGGVPPSFDWSKSENLAAARVLYPAPKRYTDRAGATLGYKGTVVFPVELTPKDPEKPINLHVLFDYGVCREICIPGEADLTLAVAPGAKDAVPEPLAAALKKVPAPKDKAGAGDPKLIRVTPELSGAKPQLLLQAEFPGGADHADIFIEAPDGIYVPLPTKTGDDGNGGATFEVDLSDGIDLDDIKGKLLTATIVSGSGQSETTFSVD
jgi:DsbC/DsbD-like thiol-disulfide interchange protein